MNPVEASYIVNEIRVHWSKLTRWEKIFINSIEKLISSGTYLKGNQGPHLIDIYKKTCANVEVIKNEV